MKKIPEITPEEIWELYRNYDFLGAGQKYRWKNWIFTDNPSARQFSSAPGEMFVINAKTKKNIESISMHVITKEKFVNLMHRMDKVQPKNLKEWLESSDV